jgi:hypothetical protein
VTNPRPRRITGRVRFLSFSPDKKDDGLTAQESVQEKPPFQESDEALVLARAIHGAGMSGVASFALHVLKPLHWMGGQALWVFQPFIEAIGVGGGGRRDRSFGVRGLTTGGIAHLLESEGGLNDLAAHLEKFQSERDYDPEKGGV